MIKPRIMLKKLYNVLTILLGYQTVLQVRLYVEWLMKLKCNFIQTNKQTK